MTVVLMAVHVLAGRLITRLVAPMLLAACGIALMVPTMTNATLSVLPLVSALCGWGIRPEQKGPQAYCGDGASPADRSA